MPSFTSNVNASPPIAHCDLTTANVLLDDHMKAKVSQGQSIWSNRNEYTAIVLPVPIDIDLNAHEPMFDPGCPPQTLLETLHTSF